MPAGDILLPTCAGGCTCGSVCSLFTANFSRPPTGSLSWTTTITGPATGPTCSPCLSVLALYNAGAGIPASPVACFNSASAGINFNWTLNFTYNSVNIYTDSGNFTTIAGTPQKLPLNPALWTFDSHSIDTVAGDPNQWSFDYSGPSVNNASIVAVVTVDNNPANAIQFGVATYDWFAFFLWTS